MSDLVELKNLLKQYQKQKKEFGLPFMNFDVYEKQKEFREKVLKRVKTGKGKKIFVCFGGNRSGKTELGASIVAELMNDPRKYKILCATVNYSMSV